MPLNALSEDRFQELAGKIIIEEVKAGRYLFRKGDRDNQSIYLLDGKVSLIDGIRKVVSEIEAGSDASRFPLAAQQPRPVSVRVTKKAVIARIDSGLLDVFLTWDQSNTADVVDINLAETSDWMTRLLQSEAFSQLPPAKLQGLLMRMRPVTVSKGKVIIRQGDPGDYFYTIHEGRCAVSRTEPGSDTEQKLAELSAGDSFGADALVAETTRNATVTMLTDGQLMRLAKQDFADLLRTEMVRYVGIEQAMQMVEAGAVWLDVRTPDEYRHNAFEDSVNIPLATLREEMSELVFNAQYIICCDTGRRSESAGFLLSHKGFDVYVLEGGITEAEERLSDGVGPEDTPGNEATPPGVAEVSPAVAPAGVGTGPEYAELQAAYEVLQQRFETLQVEHREHAQERQGLTVRLEQMQRELGESAAVMTDLHGRVAELEEEKRLLGAQYGTVQAEQFDQLQTTRIELEQERHKCVSFQREIEALSGERALLSQQLQAGQQGTQETLDSLQKQLAESQQQVAGLRADMAGAAAEKDRLEQDNRQISGELAELHAQQESAGDTLASRDDLVAGLRAGNSALEQELQAARTELADVQAQVGTMQAESAEQLAAERHAREEMEHRLQEVQERLAGNSTDAEKSVETITGLQSENSRLQNSLHEAGARNEQLADQVEQLRAEIRAAEAAHTADQEQWTQARTGLQSQLDEQLEQAGKLREELERQREQLLQAGRDFEQQRHEETERNVTALDQRDRQIADMGLKLEAETEQLELVQRDRQQLAEQLAALQDELAGTTASMEQQSGELQNELTARERQIEALRLEVDRLESARAAQDQEMEQAHARLQELQQGHAEYAEQVKSLEQSLQETERKAHEDIRRKNENEKELQAQAERLRKKLEQVTGDFQASRKDAQADLDSLREDLHAERAARDDERAQMAARQRELKEQLASIASEHEVHVNQNSGAIEEAVDAVRREERSRLQGVLDAQAATEQMLEKVQGELRQAHAELAEYHRQEKDRRQVDIDLIEEQNRQAEAAISQLHTQLRQLTEERDEALEQQLALREKMDSLRGEVEVARGLISTSTQGRIEDPAQLRKQLEETRRNVEIAVRLRAEAEAARDRMRDERDRLLAQAGGHPQAEPAGADTVAATTSQIPPALQRPSQQARPIPAYPPVTPAPAWRALRWLAAASGTLVLLLAVGLAWLAFWQTPRGPVGSTARVGQSTPHVPAPAAVAAPPSASVPAPPDTPAAQPHPVAAQAPAAAHGVTQPKTVPQAATAQPATPVHPSPVLRSYSDPLRDGGRGPEMIQLAGATYLMGSVGNSMNAEEVPRHEVKLASFSISRYEVTFAEYDRYARATGQRLPYDKSWGRDRQPVINVSWNDANGYVQWLSAQTGRTYRLPAEAQWEYAARAGSTGSFWWTDKRKDIPANCFNCGSSWDGARTAPVGQFAANSFGLYDTAGNVQEWTEDCYHPNYVGAPADGGAWQGAMDCMQRVVRGGAYSSPLDSLRSARRAQLSEDTRLDNLGFRVVRVN